MSDLSAVYMSEPKEELAIDGSNINPVDLDTVVINCKKIELRSDHIMVKIDPDKMSWVKSIVINGRKYKLVED